MTDDLISKISNREISELDFIKLAEKNDEGFDKFFNRFYLSLARLFLNGEYSYDVCNNAATWLFGVMIHESLISKKSYKVPSPAYEVFIAFDEGEYEHQNDDSNIDPIEKYTVRMLEDILSASVGT